MFKSAKARVAIALTAGALSVGAIAAPAASAQPVVTGGLVNVTVTNLLNNNQVSVQVPIGVAANVCGVQANVLAQSNVQDPVDCTALTNQQFSATAFRL
jgi:hypothetical protein